jgi:hypothetical protein
MRNLVRSIAIFHKIACSASLEATTAIITITARSTSVMFTIVCIFRGDGAHDLLCIVCVGCWMLDLGWMTMYLFL